MLANSALKLAVNLGTLGCPQLNARTLARLGVSAMSEVSAVTLLVLRCSDVELARVFYEVLGLQLVAEQHSGGPRHYSANLAGTLLELYPRADLDTRGLRIGFRVDNVSAAVAGLAKAGGRVLRFDALAKPAFALVEDPDGHKIELTEAAPVN